MENSLRKSKALALRLMNHAPKEWKVLIIALSHEGSIAIARSRISFAALFVKVTARMDSGKNLLCLTRCAILVVITLVLPVPAPARMRRRFPS